MSARGEQPADPSQGPGPRSSSGPAPSIPWPDSTNPVGPRARFLAALATWLMLILAQPGLVRSEGFGHWAFVALAPWGYVCCRPGRRAFLAEWAAAAIGLACWSAWMRHLLPGLVPLMGLIPALYVAAAGVLLRRLARRWPLALAVPAAWMAGELVRWHLPAPFSFGWWRLGIMAHATEWLRGSARVWGVWGVTWVYAAFGGWLADLLLLRARDLLGAARLHTLRAIHLLGLVPVAAAMGLTIFVPPPASEAGPRVMVVQPGIEQERKVRALEPLVDIYADMCDLTHEGLEQTRARGEPPPDLVAWGETMYPFFVVEPEVLAAWGEGARFPPWARVGEVDEDDLRRLVVQEDVLLRRVFIGDRGASSGFGGRLAEDLRALGREWAQAALAGEPLLPDGTSFFVGVRSLVLHQGEIRSVNGAVLWDAGGGRHGPAGKVHLVPGAEDPYGFERFDFILDLMERVGGFVPNFVAPPEAAVLPLETRDGRRFALGVSICYDNAFDDPYTRPLRREAVDFHLIASNEAWYRRSVEMDHMLAFSRMIAAATGRSVLRATNSGISALIGPDGSLLEVLEGPEGPKMARGVGTWTVPVPVRDGAGRAPRTVFVLTERAQLLGWLLAIALLALLSRSAVTVEASGVEPPTGP